MSTTPGSGPEVEETKAEQLPPPPETIYVAELDPTSPEYRAAAEERTEEDREKANAIREDLRKQKEQEESMRRREVGGLLDFAKRRLKDYINGHGVTTPGMSFGAFCNEYNKKLSAEAKNMDESNYEPFVDKRIIQVIKNIERLTSENNPRVILGILEDVGGDYGTKRVNTFALRALVGDF